MMMCQCSTLGAKNWPDLKKPQKKTYLKKAYEHVSETEILYENKPTDWKKGPESHLNVVHMWHIRPQVVSAAKCTFMTEQNDTNIFVLNV